VARVPSNVSVVVVVNADHHLDFNLGFPKDGLSLEASGNVIAIGSKLYFTPVTKHLCHLSSCGPRESVLRLSLYRNADTSRWPGTGVS